MFDFTELMRKAVHDRRQEHLHYNCNSGYIYIKKRQIAVYCLLLFWGFIDQTMAKERLMLGYVEKVTLVDYNLTISAKLDSGAKTASLSAIRIRKSQQQSGKTILSFFVPINGKLIPLKAEYVGRVLIKSRSHEYLQKGFYMPLKRPAVRLKLRLGREERMIRVNLTNRKRFNYPLLLGREAIIAFNGFIDPNATFLIKDNASIKYHRS